MAIRQEPERETRPYNYSARPVPGVPKYRTGTADRPGPDYSRMPDYEKLPSFTLLGVSEVVLITGMGKSALERRIKEGKFPAARKNGKDRVWPLGVVREWCEAMAYADYAEGGAA